MDAKKNAFWIVCGVIALFAAIFWGVAVAGGKNAAIAKAKKELDNKVRDLQKYAEIKNESDVNEGMPVPALVTYWEKKKKAYEDERDAILSKYKERDKKFEELTAGGKLEVSSFVDNARKEIGDLRSKYKAQLDDPAAGDKVFPLKDFEDIKEGEEAKIPLAQKQLNCLKAIAEAVKDADPGAKLVSIGFPPPTGSAAPGKEKPEISRIPCDVEIRVPFPSLPKVVSNLLQKPASPRSYGLVFVVSSIGAEASSFTLEHFAAFGLFQRNPSQPNAQPGSGLKNFNDDVYVATRDVSNPKPTPELDEPAVGVKLSLAALDFDLPEKK